VLKDPRDPRDPWAYRIAIAALGFAVAVIFAGICLIAATPGVATTFADTTTHGLKVPMELWFAGGAMGGVFVGTLIPFRLRVQYPESGCSCPSCGSQHDVFKPALGWIAGGIFLLAIGIAATVVGLAGNYHSLDALGATTGGVLLGLPIPSPGRRDQ
jgi:hypothetical protein